MTIGRKLAPASRNDFDGTAFAWALLAFIVILLGPLDVWAEDLTLGLIVCHIRGNIIPIAPLLSAMAYVAGAMLGISGLMLLKKHADNPNDSQVVKALAHLLGGGALAVFPAAVGTMQATLHLGASASGGKDCAPGTPVSGAAGLDTMMQNFVNNIYQPMFSALSVLSFLVGAFLIYRGLLKGSKVGTDPRAAATHSILVNLLIGGVMVSIGAMLPVMEETLFGPTTTTFSGINWTAIVGTADTTKADLTIKAILMFVQVIGAIAFVRGWLMIKNAVEGTAQVTVPQGLTHVIGGTMAINIGTMLKLFDTTFGTGLIN
ncbi:MAG: hypothetical protein PHY92_04600 [Alphaproteobacteria bacterium]|nr:hypothetical protein [Alphaproteobacteria bacterium]